MTQEEYRNHVYSKYDKELRGGIGGYLPPDNCYEMINERKVTDHRTRYSRHNNYYKINW